MCTYMCTYIYVYIYTYICTYIHTYVYIHTGSEPFQIPVCMYTGLKLRLNRLAIPQEPRKAWNVQKNSRDLMVKIYIEYSLKYAFFLLP